MKFEGADGTTGQGLPARVTDPPFPIWVRAWAGGCQSWAPARPLLPQCFHPSPNRPRLLALFPTPPPRSGPGYSIGDAGATELVRALQTNMTLTQLDLGGTGHFTYGFGLGAWGGAWGVGGGMWALGLDRARLWGPRRVGWARVVSGAGVVGEMSWMYLYLCVGDA